MSSLIINPSTDGITHINVYSKAKTLLGQALTNFAHTPFEYPGFGHFESVEAFWYYYLTGCQHEHLRMLHGYTAKKAGQKLRDDRLDKEGLSDEQKNVILEAIRCKLRQHKDIRTALTESHLPLTHYYAYGDDIKGYRVVFLPEYDWIIDELARIRDVCHTHQQSKQLSQGPT